MPIFNPDTLTEDESSAVQALINSRLQSYNSNLGLNKILGFLNSWAALLFADSNRSMFGAVSDKDANLMVAGKGIVTLFLTLVNDSITLEQLKAKKDFKGLDIAEWVYVGAATNPQAKAYLDAFGKLGLKEYGMIIWTSYQNKIGSYIILNRDGTTFISGK